MERTVTKKICWAGFGLIVLACIAMFIASCGTAEGVTMTVREKLTVQQAPSRNKLQPGGQCDLYRVYYATNPTDLKTKPVSQLSFVDGINRPAPYNQPDSITFDYTITTGRVYYFKAVAGIRVYVQQTADTTRADSTLTTVFSDSLSNYATRTYPLVTGDKPANVTSVN
jgi:hypothetical protein